MPYENLIGKDCSVLQPIKFMSAESASFILRDREKIRICSVYLWSLYFANNESVQISTVM